MRTFLFVTAIAVGLLASVVFFNELQACNEAGGVLVRGFSVTGYVCMR